MIGIIVAFSKNRVIGIENQLPWDIPNDLSNFKKETMGKTIVMGRKTFESIGRPLLGRKNVVISRSNDWSHKGVEVIHSLEEIKDMKEDVMIIGGSKIYEQTLDMAERLFVTKIDHIFDGDAFFPEIDMTKWKRIKREKGKKDEKNPYDYYFEIYERK